MKEETCIKVRISLEDLRGSTQVDNNRPKITHGKPHTQMYAVCYTVKVFQ
jgi:hypothetical protein